MNLPLKMLLYSLALIKTLHKQNSRTANVSDVAATKVQRTEKLNQTAVEQKDPYTARTSSETMTTADSDKQGLPLPK